MSNPLHDAAEACLDPEDIIDGLFYAQRILRRLATCPTCGGSGIDPDGLEPPNDTPCPDCEGTGHSQWVRKFGTYELPWRPEDGKMPVGAKALIIPLNLLEDTE